MIKFNIKCINKIIKRKNWIFLGAGSLVSGMGTMVQQFALSFYVLRITGSASEFALIITIGTAVRLIFLPVGGVISDRYDRKSILVGMDLLSGVITLGFAGVFLVKGQVDFIEIVIYMSIMQIISAIFEPAVSATIPSIVEKEELLKANALFTSIKQIGSVSSPLVAGILYHNMGILFVFVMNGVSFIVSSLSEIFIEMPKQVEPTEKLSVQSFFFDFIQSIKFIFNSKRIIGLVVLGVFVNFAFSGLFGVYMPYVLIEKLGISEVLYGVFMSCVLMSMILGPYIGVLWSKYYDIENVIVSGVFLSSSMFLCVSMYFSVILPEWMAINQLGLIVIGIPIAMACMSISIVNICITTLFQSAIPNELLGRVNSSFSVLVMIASPIGQMTFGILLGVAPASMGFVVTSLCGLIGVLMFSALEKLEKKQMAV